MSRADAISIPCGPAILRASEAELRLQPGRHPFERDNSAAIARHWQGELAANPKLFDGQVVLFSSLVLVEGRLAGRCHLVSYSTLLYWRAVPGMRKGEHVFAHAVPVSADGKLLAIRMGSHTANAGQVYFAAGSFEPQDFRDGRADIDANMRREVAEETGLDLGAMRPEPALHILRWQDGTAILRRFFAAESADELAARVRAHVAGENEPEIEGPVVIGAADEAPTGLASHMPPILEWHFGASSE